MITIVNRSDESIDFRTKGHSPNNAVTGTSVAPGTYITLYVPADPVVKLALFSSIGTLCVKCGASEDTTILVYLSRPVSIQKRIRGVDFGEITQEFIPVISIDKLDHPNFSFDTVYDLVEPYKGTPMLGLEDHAVHSTLCVKCNATENTVVDLYLDKPVYIQKNISNTDNMEMLKDFIPVVSLGQLDSPNFSFDTVYDLVEPYNGTVRMLQFTRRSLYGRTGSFN
ncbi:hypothetical protein LPJ53_005117 [Coemansia erecta]|uniref:Uncharacterized protein n=1 Tax=Coemansia erecta TaxID=147472 RepID=A0A9W7XT34_9FUNG|nr:hypothetical protein LPJ53_005117 [Coemansia erecta]